MTGRGLVTWAEGASSGGNVGAMFTRKRMKPFAVLTGLIVLVGYVHHMITNVILESFDLAHFCRE